LLAKAYRLNPLDPDAKRAIIGAESKAQLENMLQAAEQDVCTELMQNYRPPSPIKLTGEWLCIGEQIVQQRNGLVNHTSYLWPMTEHQDHRLNTPAMLVDHYPASVGKRQSSLKAGVTISGDLSFYPSSVPQRAILNQYRIIECPTTNSLSRWQALPRLNNSQLSIAEQFILLRQRQPWLSSLTTLVGPCQIFRSQDDNFWLQLPFDTLKLSNKKLAEPCGGLLLNACVRWNGYDAELITVVSPHFGVISC